jgi:hypothetical protein
MDASPGHGSISLVTAYIVNVGMSTTCCWLPHRAHSSVPRTPHSPLTSAVQLDVVLNMESSGFVCLLDAENIDVLRRIYSIVCRIPDSGTKYIKELMSQHVKDVGKVLH